MITLNLLITIHLALSVKTLLEEPTGRTTRQPVISVVQTQSWFLPINMEVNHGLLHQHIQLMQMVNGYGGI